MSNQSTRISKITTGIAYVIAVFFNSLIMAVAWLRDILLGVIGESSMAGVCA